VGANVELNQNLTYKPVIFIGVVPVLVISILTFSLSLEEGSLVIATLMLRAADAYAEKNAINAVASKNTLRAFIPLLLNTSSPCL
jgi:hypothetical protein